MKNRLHALLTLAVAATLSHSALAEPGLLANFDYNDTPYGVAEPLAFMHDPTVTVSRLTRHGSVTGGDVQKMVYSGFGTTLDTNNYVGFTVTPKAGDTLNITHFQFFCSYYNRPAGAQVTWGYRINEGSGYSSWVFPGGTGPDISNPYARYELTFPTPIVTTGTVEFGIFSATPTPAGMVTVQDPTLHGTAGDTTPDPSQQGVISQYTRVSTIVTRNVEKESSAITYDWDTDSLYVVDDEGASVQNLSKTGALLGNMRMLKLKFPSGNKADPEALTYLGKDTEGYPLLMLGAERENVSMIVRYRQNQWNTPDWIRDTPAIVWGPLNGNLGLEGMSPDQTDGSIWGVNESQPVGLKQVTNFGTPSQTVTSIDMNDLKWRLNMYSVSDIYVMSNSAAYADSDHLLILSRSLNKILEVTKDGLLVDSVSLAHTGRDSIEGITMDNDGVIYLCSEGVSSIDYSKTWGAVHVLTKPKNIVRATTNRQAVVGTAGDDEIKGNPSADVLTGHGGADNFIFTSLRDGVDTITDFTPGVDILDLTYVLRSMNYNGVYFNSYTPLEDGTVRVVDSASGALVQVKSGTSYRTLVILQGLTAAQANVENNFRFLNTSAPTP